MKGDIKDNSTEKFISTILEKLEENGCEFARRIESYSHGGTAYDSIEIKCNNGEYFEISIDKRKSYRDYKGYHQASENFDELKKDVEYMQNYKEVKPVKSKVKISFESKLRKQLELEMMYSEKSITPYETALQLLFTDWHESAISYDGMEEDRQIIANECESIIDLESCIPKHQGSWNFEKTEYWNKLYSK